MGDPDAAQAGLLLEAPEWTAARFVLPGLFLAFAAAALARPLARRWPARGRVPRRMVAVAVLGAAAVLVPGLRRNAPDPGSAGAGPNLLLVTVDTLRRDALAAYGGPWSTALDSLEATAHEGWAVCSWTQPSMASLFSGVVPSGHGSDAQHGPDPAVAWWPEQVQRSGRATAAFVTNPYLRRRFGFDRGFTTYDHAEERPWLEPVARTVLAEYLQAWLSQRDPADRADTLVGRARRWLDGTTASRPWFLWVHLLDPHLPYELRGQEGRARVDGSPDWARPLEGQYEDGGFEDLRGAREGQVIADEASRAALRRLYQTEVGFAAWWTRELIRAAEAASGSRELVWVVTSDHGEEFFEEGGFEHGHSLGDPVLRVPLLARGLGEVPRPLRLVDIGPRVLERLGLGQDFDPAQGSGLQETDEVLHAYSLGSATPDSACSRRPVMMAEGMLYGPARTRITLGDGRVVERSDDTGAVRQVHACGLPDPGLSVPWRQLDLWRERRGVSPRGMEVDDDLRRQLRALGYAH